jgi:hypothetical protein
MQSCHSRRSMPPAALLRMVEMPASLQQRSSGAACSVCGCPITLEAEWQPRRQQTQQLQASSGRAVQAKLAVQKLLSAAAGSLWRHASCQSLTVGAQVRAAARRNRGYHEVLAGSSACFSWDY